MISQLYCGRCGLKVTIQAAFLRVENCPRCLARSATFAPLAHAANTADAPRTPDQPTDTSHAARRGPAVALAATVGDGFVQASRGERALIAGQLTIRSERHAAAHVVAVSGELDLATAQALEDELKAVEATDADQITLDLCGLDFIDSTGLHLIITADARSKADGHRLRLLPGPPHVQRIFEITATTALLPFAAS